MHVTVIINPVAGQRKQRNSAHHRVELATAVLAAARVKYSVHVTESEGHAFALARDAVAYGATLVCAWGGDGTVNEVGRALAFGSVALAIIPGGSGNGLARELGIPLRSDQALRTALQGAERLIDAGELAGQLFFNAAGIGFDAQVCASFNTRLRRRRGLLSYLTIVARELFVYQARSYRVTSPQGTSHHRALLIAVANSRQYGNRAKIAPQARIDDGLLDIVIVHERPPLVALWDTRHLFTGTLLKAKGISLRKVEHMTVSASGPIRCHIDGESITVGTSVAIRVRPGALRVRVGSAAASERFAFSLPSSGKTAGRWQREKSKFLL